MLLQHARTADLACALCFSLRAAMRSVAIISLVFRKLFRKNDESRRMRLPNYKRSFLAATAGNAPFDYQCRLACGDRDNQSEDQWLASGTPSASRPITIPTGCGKTAAVMLAWFWNRISLSNSNWPRHVAYCLPMRTLVEQTGSEVQHKLENILFECLD
jgi:CRISPR/Cas system-associated endonuclease/helicase Cas3